MNSRKEPDVFKILFFAALFGVVVGLVWGMTSA